MSLEDGVGAGALAGRVCGDGEAFTGAGPYDWLPLGREDGLVMCEGLDIVEGFDATEGLEVLVGGIVIEGAAPEALEEGFRWSTSFNCFVTTCLISAYSFATLSKNWA